MGAIVVRPEEGETVVELGIHRLTGGGADVYEVTEFQLFAKPLAVHAGEYGCALFSSTSIQMNSPSKKNPSKELLSPSHLP